MDRANWAVPRDDFRVQQDVRVRFNEIDGQNIVFSGNYLIYADIGVTEYFRALGEGQPVPIFTNMVQISAKCIAKSTITRRPGSTS